MREGAKARLEHWADSTFDQVGIPQDREEFWSRVLSDAPDYEKFMRRTSRQIPFIRLTPIQPVPPVDERSRK